MRCVHHLRNLVRHQPLRLWAQRCKHYGDRLPTLPPRTCHGKTCYLSPQAAALPSRGLRYGEGLYFSKASSKSDTYAHQTERVRDGCKLRVVFLSKVALGKACLTDRSMIGQSEVNSLIYEGGLGGQYHSLVGRGEADSRVAGVGLSLAPLPHKVVS